MLYYFTVIRVLYDFQNHTAHTGSTLAHALSSGAAFPFKIDRFRFRGTLPDTERKKERKKERLIRNTQALPYHFPRYFLQHTDDRPARKRSSFPTFLRVARIFETQSSSSISRSTIRLERGGEEEKLETTREEPKRAFPLRRRSRDDRSIGKRVEMEARPVRKSFYLTAK